FRAVEAGSGAPADEAAGCTADDGAGRTAGKRREQPAGRDQRTNAGYGDHAETGEQPAERAERRAHAGAGLGACFGTGIVIPAVGMVRDDGNVFRGNVPRLEFGDGFDCVGLAVEQSDERLHDQPPGNRPFGAWPSTGAFCAPAPCWSSRTLWLALRSMRSRERPGSVTESRSSASRAVTSG